MRCALVSGPAGSGIGSGGGMGGSARVSVRGVQAPRSMRRSPLSGCCGGQKRANATMQSSAAARTAKADRECFMRFYSNTLASIGQPVIVET